MKLDEFGLLLIKAVNSTNPITKTKLLNTCDNHRKELLKKQDSSIKKQEFYFNNYEMKRDEDDVIYREYLQTRMNLSEKWNKSKNIKDLINLATLEPPSLNLPKDIYTTEIKRRIIKEKQ